LFVTAHYAVLDLLVTAHDGLGDLFVFFHQFVLCHLEPLLSCFPCRFVCRIVWISRGCAARAAPFPAAGVTVCLSPAGSGRAAAQCPQAPPGCRGPSCSTAWSCTCPRPAPARPQRPAAPCPPPCR